MAESNERMEMIVKRVRFSDDTKDTPPSKTLNFSKPKASNARKTWITRCCNREYEQLKQDLKLWAQKGLTIRSIFEQEGKVILDWAISSFPDSEPLRFLCESSKLGLVPEQLISDILKMDDFSIMRIFLRTECGIENLNFVTQETLKNRHEKIKLLLTINGVKEFLEQNLSDTGIHENVRCAIKDVFQEDNKSGHGSVKQ